MEVSLPSDLAEFVAWKVKAGQYESEAEVVRDALRQLQRLGSASAVGASRGFPNLGGPGSDIEQLVFVVLTNATNSAQDDLKEIMAEVKAITAAKNALRKLVGQIRRDAAANAGEEQTPLNFSTGVGSEEAYHRAQVPVPDPTSESGVQLVAADLFPGEITTVAQIQAVLQQLQERLDGMSDMSQMTSLRLQIAVDRRSKLVETLSNIMKEISATNDTLVQNLK